jgi:hypothetical protein
VLSKQITELIEGFVKSFDSSRPPILEWRKAHNKAAAKLIEQGLGWSDYAVGIIAKEVTRYLQDRADFIWEKLQGIITSTAVTSYPELHADLKNELAKHFYSARAVIEREFPPIILSTREPSGFAIEIARGFDNILIKINAEIELFCAKHSAEGTRREQGNAPTFGVFNGVYGDVTNSQVTVNDFGRVYQILKDHKIPKEARNEFEEIWDSLKSSSEDKKQEWIHHGQLWIEKYKAELGKEANVIGNALTNQSPFKPNRN